MKLDLSINGKLTPEVAIIFNEIAESQRVHFVNFIKECSLPHTDNLDWWVAGPASRNTLVSPLFHYYCCFFLVRTLCEREHRISEIIVDSNALKGILVSYFEQSGRQVCLRLVLSRKERLKRLFFPWLFYLFFLFLRRVVSSIHSHYYSWKSKSTTSLLAGGPPRVLIDTVLSPNFIEQDRTYSGLWEGLTEKEREGVYFVPHLYGFPKKELLTAYQQIRGGGKSFLLKEDFLHFSDYLFALGHLWRVLQLRVAPVKIEGIDCSALVKEELKLQAGYPTATHALLNYRFALRLREVGVSPQLVINRFENQVIDKGWNAGFQHFFPATKRIGYQGFIASEHYLCMYPTQLEGQSGVLPTVVAVIGSGHEALKKEFFPQLKTTIAPAFRFDDVWRKPLHNPVAGFFTILVALPIGLHESCLILQQIEKSLELLSFDSSLPRFWIKPHPTVQKAAILKAYGKQWPQVYEFVNDTFTDCVEQANLLLANLSSVCLETIAKGIPVILVGNSEGLTHNPIPRTIKENIWCACNNPIELAKSIEFYQENQDCLQSHFQQIGKNIRHEFFEPCSPEGIRKFIGIIE